MTAHSITLTDVDNCGHMVVQQDPAASLHGDYFLQFQTKNTLPYADLNISQVKQLIVFLQAQVDAIEPQGEPEVAPAVRGELGYATLSDQAKTLYQHMSRAGSISAREAMDDHGVTSATLARRICDIEDHGFKVNRDRRIHPITGKRYTRYSLG